jgi:hypothetical protein
MCVNLSVYIRRIGTQPATRASKRDFRVKESPNMMHIHGMDKFRVMILQIVAIIDINTDNDSEYLQVQDNTSPF